LRYYTICLPSNRPLKESRTAIDSAIAFTAATGGYLVISDNSADPAKPETYAQLPDHVTYLCAPGLSAMDNLLNCLNAITTDFVLPMGDDDMIRQQTGLPPFDFARLDPRFVGVKPQTEISVPTHGIVATSLFHIDDASPKDRMTAYARKSSGSNASYYSYFRTACFRGLISLVAEAHPTKGGYIDWALVISLMAMGKMADDPSTVFTYNAGYWGHADGIREGRKNLFLKAHLPEGAERFDALFNFLDCCAFVSGPVSPLTRPEKADARQGAALIYLRQFFDRVDADPESFADYRPAMQALRQESKAMDTQPENMIPHVLMLVEMIRPGLAEAYARFLAKTMGV
jgi:hypothetical protein